MNKEYFYKIILLNCLLLLFTLFARAEDKFQTPEQYAQIVQKYFTNEEWEEGKDLLEVGLQKFPIASDIQWLMGKYWHHNKNYDKSRYHLIKAVEANYNNVNAKHLLVDVEEITKNYSSAICYVNELLEVNPYWIGLWRRKIQLYRKQGNEIEANRLLKRINQIYPNDTILRKDYIYNIEEEFRQLKKTGNRKEAINQLTELIKISPKNEEYYMDLINLNLQEGNQEAALNWTSSGLSEIPGSTAIIKKRAGILGELSRYPEALVFLQMQIKKNNSPLLRQLYNEMLLETARAEKQKDPYVLYGMIYESGKNKEALDYLLNTSLSRGYNDDALYYIKEAKKIYGNTNKSLLYKEYQLYRQMNEDDLAYAALNRLYEMYPNDYDIALSMCEQHMKKAERMISLGLYAEALPHALFVTKKNLDNEMNMTAWERTLACYINMKHYNEALKVLDSLTLNYPEYDGTWKRTFILDKMGRTEEALNIFQSAIEHSDENNRIFYSIGYEELAIPYIKKSIEEGATRKAYNLAIQLLELNPSSDLGLRYAINSAGLLGQFDKFEEFTKQGISYYPNEPFYQIKQATILDREKKHDLSLNLLRPMLDKYSGNKELIGAFSQSSEFRALELTKAKEPEKALAILDTALVYDSQNKSLKYTKGLAYEVNKQADSAYYYQKFYEPSIMEYKSFERHLTGLRNTMFKNEVALTYLQARYGEEDIITSVATVEYIRKNEKNIYSGRFNYAGRSGSAKDNMDIEEQTPGGVGIQMQGEWTHKFSKEWSGTINAAYATKYFPIITADVLLKRYLKNDWELGIHFGYRRPSAYDKTYQLDTSATNETTGTQGVWLFDHWKESKTNLFTAGVETSKTIDELLLFSKLDLHLYNSSFYYNAQIGAKYFPIDDGRTNIMATASIGSAPETATLDYALPGSFSHTNTMVGLGGQYLLTHNISLGLMGTWNTYYNQNNVRIGDQNNYKDETVTFYKNLYNIYVQVYISF